MAKAVILKNRLLAKDDDFVEFWRAGGRSQMLELEWGGGTSDTLRCERSINAKNNYLRKRQPNYNAAWQVT